MVNYCKICGKIISEKRKFCSVQCNLIQRHKENTGKHYNKDYGQIKCIDCHNMFSRTNSKQKRCSDCQNKYRQTYQAKYREQNKERIRPMIAQYFREEKGRFKARLNDANRRHKKKIIVQSFTQEEWNTKVNKTEGVCPICGKNVGVEKLTLDHIHPISKAKKGQIYTIDDIQPMCRSCNSKKGDRL